MRRDGLARLPWVMVDAGRAANLLRQQSAQLPGLVGNEGAVGTLVRIRTHCLAGARRNGAAHQPDTTSPALISRCVRSADVIKVNLSVSIATLPLSARTAASRIVTVPAPGSSASGVTLTELNCDHQAR